MPSDVTSQLESLHALVIDAQNGYREALEKTEGSDLTALFESMAALHGGHAYELSVELLREGVEVGSDGSLLTLVHKTIIDMKSLLGGDKASLLPGMIDGESRIVARYDAALAETDLPASQAEVLRRQRDRLGAKVEEMQRLQALSDQSKKAG